MDTCSRVAHERAENLVLPTLEMFCILTYISFRFVQLRHNMTTNRNKTRVRENEMKKVNFGEILPQHSQQKFQQISGIFLVSSVNGHSLLAHKRLIIFQLRCNNISPFTVILQLLCEKQIN
jgi:hypothetical protein